MAQEQGMASEDQPNDWARYGVVARGRGCLALEVFAVLSVRVRPQKPRDTVLQDHLAYQKKLEAAERLVLAGPLSDDAGEAMSGNGLMIYRAASIDEARQMAADDPMHRAGFRRFRVVAWRLNEGALLGGSQLSSGKV